MREGSHSFSVGIFHQRISIPQQRSSFTAGAGPPLVLLSYVPHLPAGNQCWWFAGGAVVLGGAGGAARRRWCQEVVVVAVVQDSLGGGSTFYKRSHSHRHWIKAIMPIHTSQRQVSAVSSRTRRP